MNEMLYCQRGERTKEKQCKTVQHRAAVQWSQGLEIKKRKGTDRGKGTERGRKKAKKERGAERRGKEGKRRKKGMEGTKAN